MIEKKRVSDIFFDLDHTLWDFERNSSATFDALLGPYSADFSLESFMHYYTPINHFYWKQYRENKISTNQLRKLRLEKTFDALGVTINHHGISKLSEAYLNKLSDHTHLFEGTEELLKYLTKNYRLHIITNGFENVQQKKIKNAGLAHFFEIVLTAEHAEIKKPNPAIFLKAVEMANSIPSQSLMIGDSFEADIQGALNVGMQAIHFNSHGEPLHSHCPIVKKLSEITQYL